MDDIYDLLDKASVGKHYDWASLHIDLNFNKTDIDLDAVLNGTKEFGNSKNEIFFVHEYTHYLQNFHCNWGAFVFCELVLALNKIGASKAVDTFKIKLPLKIEKVDNATLWNKGVYHYDKFVSLIGSQNEYKRFEAFCTNSEFCFKIENENTLMINNGRLTYGISNKAIREHMAEVCSYLFANYTDLQIHENYINSNFFCSSHGILDKNPEYWMLFEYFYSKKCKQVAEGIAVLCHAALSTANPLEMIVRLFKFIEDETIIFSINSDLLMNIYRFLNIPTEVIAFSYSYYTSLTKIVENLKLCSSNDDHDFFKFNTEIFINLMSNISGSFSGKLYFLDPTCLRDKNYWVSLIKRTGTPIIRYKDKVPVITNFNNSKLTESLTYFMGVMKVIQNLQDSAKCNCPFHSEYDICKAHYKNNENCLDEPLLVKNPNEDGKECLYQNAIELIGLDERIGL